MSIVMVLVVMGIVGIAALSIMTMGNQKRKMSRQMNVAVSANLVKQKLVGMVMSPSIWQATQKKNTSVFENTSQKNSSINIYMPNSQPGSSSPTLYYQPTNPQAGFDLKGNPCTTFSPNGNNDCPLRYDITLKSYAMVNGNRIDTLHFALSFRPASSDLILRTDTSEFTFDLARNLNEQSVESACISVNGTYDGNTNACSVKVTKSVDTCKNGQTYRGPASNDQGTNCDNKTVAVTSCAANQVIKGFDQNGNPICGAPRE